MLTLWLHNFTSNSVGLEQVLTWQTYNKLQNIADWQTYNITLTCLWSQETEGKAREGREKVSPPLDPAAVFAGGQGPPVVGVCQGACSLWVYTSWVPVLIASRKLSKWVGGLGGHLVVSQPPPATLVAALHKCLTFLPTWHPRGREDKGQWAQTEAQEVPSEYEEEFLHSEGDGALE